MANQWLCGKCGKRFGVNDVVQVTGGDSRPHHSDCDDPRRERERAESDVEFTDRVIGEARVKAGVDEPSSFASVVEVVDNSTVDRTCPAGYFRVKWAGEDTWRSKVFPVSDLRLQRYLAAVEDLKHELGVYAPDEDSDDEVRGRRGVATE